MGESTNIAWCHSTFNPWIGCTKVHTGCANCYAEKLATTRLGRRWGAGAHRQVTSESNWKQPLRWARAAAKAGERRRVFCASLADVLDEEAPPKAQARLWQLIRETSSYDTRTTLGMARWSLGPGLDWLLLTKRPERWEVIPADVRSLVWLGTSVSDQATADEWVPRLLKAEGFAKRFLSVEPLVAPVNLVSTGALGCDCRPIELDDGSVEDRCSGQCAFYRAAWKGQNPLRRLDWVIVGSESGPRARPMEIAWARSLVDQCLAADVPIFTKQLATERARQHGDSKGGDPEHWPPDIWPRQFPKGSS